MRLISDLYSTGHIQMINSTIDIWIIDLPWHTCFLISTWDEALSCLEIVFFLWLIWSNSFWKWQHFSVSLLFAESTHLCISCDLEVAFSPDCPWSEFWFWLICIMRQIFMIDWWFFIVSNCFKSSHIIQTSLWKKKSCLITHIINNNKNECNIRF